MLLCPNISLKDATVYINLEFCSWQEIRGFAQNCDLWKRMQRALCNNYLQQLPNFCCGHPVPGNDVITLDTSTQGPSVQAACETADSNDANVTGTVAS
jgi:hypothetical protein